MAAPSPVGPAPITRTSTYVEPLCSTRNVRIAFCLTARFAETGGEGGVTNLWPCPFLCQKRGFFSDSPLGAYMDNGWEANELVNQ